MIFSVGSVSEEGTGAKVDELHLVALQVNEDILVLHVTMDHALGQTVLDSFQDLLEEVAGRPLADGALLGDVVKEVDVFLWTLHDNVELVLPFEEVEQLDDVVLLEIVQEGNLLGYHSVSNLIGERENSAKYSKTSIY